MNLIVHYPRKFFELNSSLQALPRYSHPFQQSNPLSYSKICKRVLNWKPFTSYWETNSLPFDENREANEDAVERRRSVDVGRDGFIIDSGLFVNAPFVRVSALAAVPGLFVCSWLCFCFVFLFWVVDVGCRPSRTPIHHRRSHFQFIRPAAWREHASRRPPRNRQLWKGKKEKRKRRIPKTKLHANTNS